MPKQYKSQPDSIENQQKTLAQQIVSCSKLNRVVSSTHIRSIATVPNKSQLKWAKDQGDCQ